MNFRLTYGHGLAILKTRPQPNHHGSGHKYQTRQPQPPVLTLIFSSCFEFLHLSLLIPIDGV